MLVSVMTMSDRVSIFDTTLRDGEQSPGCSMTVPEKLRMARKLVDLGVDFLEAGFPIASDGDFEAVDAVSREFPEAIGMPKRGTEPENPAIADGEARLAGAAVEEMVEPGWEPCGPIKVSQPFFKA